MAAVYWDARTEAETVAAEPRWILHENKYREVGSASTYLTGTWGERNWRNVPGPFYGADTDTCVAGVPTAPEHVLCDDYGMEFVWRQPRDLDEVRAVLDAAYQDPFHGYGWDGDDHWTPDLVLDWWNDRGRVDEWLAMATFSDHGSMGPTLLRAASAYRAYLAGGLGDDLARYAEWLANRG